MSSTTSKFLGGTLNVTELFEQHPSIDPYAILAHADTPDSAPTFVVSLAQAFALAPAHDVQPHLVERFAEWATARVALVERAQAVSAMLRRDFPADDITNLPGWVGTDWGLTLIAMPFSQRLEWATDEAVLWLAQQPGMLVVE